MPQNQSIFGIGEEWPFLEAGENPSWARTDHIKLVAAPSGQTVTYRYGQTVCQKDDGTNNWAKKGTAGFNGAQRLIKYTITVNDQGQWQYGSSFVAAGLSYPGQSVEEGSVAAYYQGMFKAQDLLGVNEVQTETVTASGGNRTLSFKGSVTANIAYNANAAAIQAALEALPTIDPGDVAVTGTGPYVYTFAGQYSGADVPLLIVNPAGLTGGSSSFASTGGGLAGIGKLVRGNRDNGMVRFEGYSTADL